MTAAHCPVCSAAAHVALSKDGQSVWQCAGCTLRFVDQPPADVTSLYDPAYFTGASGEYGDYLADEASHRRMARRYLRRIARDADGHGRLLDVGCAAGFFLDEARRAGWSTAGIEVSDYAAGHARSRLGLDVTTGAFPVALPDIEPVNVVTFCNVLEHLAAPRAVEARLRSCIRPGGIVAIETWDWQSVVARRLGADWHQYDPRLVFAYYSRQSLEALFSSPAWELVRFERATKWISARRALDVLERKHRLPLPSALRRLVRRADVPYRLGDLVWAVVRRRSG